jgi:hypothetical protein
VSLLPCSNCKKRVRGKLASVYMAWFSGSQRVSKKARLCMPCVSDYAEFVRGLKPLPADEDAVEWPDTCSLCGSALAQDFDPTYLTVYMPKSEPVQLIIAGCETCSIDYRPTLASGAENLADRQAAGRVEGAPSREEQAFPDIQWTLTA